MMKRRRFPKAIDLAVFLFAAAVVPAYLSGCAVGGVPAPSASSDIQEILSTGCPLLQTLVATGIKLNKYQTAALQTLSLACPPNPPPNTATTAFADILEAYQLLSPLLLR